MENAIRRPDAPNHFMVLKPVAGRVVVRLPDGAVLAESSDAVRLLEAGKTLFDPVVYLPFEDVRVPLEKQSKTTHCPLKGDASYFSISLGGELHDGLAWSYEQPLDFAKPIRGLVAFYSSRVVVEEHPVS